jgi:hypothetical protein
MFNGRMKMTHASQNSMLIGKHGQGLDFPLRAVKLIAVLFVVLIIPALSCATVCAQGVIIPKVEPRLTLYNALYYSIDGALLHVEIVRSVENRKLVGIGERAVPSSQLCDVNDTQCRWERTTTPTLMSDLAVYAYYYGIDYPAQPQESILEKPLAIEDVFGKFRVLEVLVKNTTIGNEVQCLAPKCCLCGTIQACCACVTCPRH